MADPNEPIDDSESARQRRGEQGGKPGDSSPPAKPGQGRSGGGPRVPKTTGGFSGGWAHRYKPGQNVICRVMKAERGGYSVVIVKENAGAFLPTNSILPVGEDVLAQFVCVSNGRIIVSSRLSNASPMAPNSQNKVRWEDQLHQIHEPVQEESGYESGQLEADTIDASPPESMNMEPAAAMEAPAPMSAQPEAVEALIPPPPPAPKKLHLKRATDLIMPPIEGVEAERFTIEENDLEWLITISEGGLMTGCLKATSEERLSRSAMLLYRGRAVGCLYGCKSQPETQPIEQSLQRMLSDLELPSSSVTKYDLPEDVTLAMSALFMGHPVTRDDNADAITYLNHVSKWFDENKQTACIAITLPSTAATCFVFVCNGKFSGAFYVEEQIFTRDHKFVVEILKKDPQARVDVSILPPDVLTAARYGYSLSMIRQGRM
ncbi:MAG TPA: hypothetical protein V6C72_13430 [Chroococcales cyanobacterium]